MQATSWKDHPCHDSPIPSCTREWSLKRRVRDRPWLRSSLCVFWKRLCPKARFRDVYSCAAVQSVSLSGCLFVFLLTQCEGMFEDETSQCSNTCSKDARGVVYRVSRCHLRPLQPRPGLGAWWTTCTPTSSSTILFSPLGDTTFLELQDPGRLHARVPAGEDDQFRGELAGEARVCGIAPDAASRTSGSTHSCRTGCQPSTQRHKLCCSRAPTQRRPRWWRIIHSPNPFLQFEDLLGGAE